MALIPESVQALIDAFSRLPGIGPRTASRLTFFLLKNESDAGENLAEALTKLKSETAFCPECFNIMNAGKERCDICASSSRDDDVLCVVESPMDVIVLEQSGGYFGKYHVLHGALPASRRSTSKVGLSAVGRRNGSSRFCQPTPKRSSPMLCSHSCAGVSQATTASASHPA